VKNLKTVWVLLFMFVLYSCVTVNIYFPAQEAQEKAKKIVNEIRGKIDKKTSPTSLNFNIFIQNAYASNRALNITNAKIETVKRSMKTRFKKMIPYYKNGYLAELINGYVKIYKTPHSLKDKMILKKLVSNENNDRKILYKEVAKALNIQSSQIDKLQKIFAKQWQDTAPKGTYIQTKTGWIRK